MRVPEYAPKFIYKGEIEEKLLSSMQPLNKANYKSTYLISQIILNKFTYSNVIIFQAAWKTRV